MSVNVGLLVQSPPATAGGLAFEERLKRTFALGEGEPYLLAACRRESLDPGVQQGVNAAKGMRA